MNSWNSKVLCRRKCRFIRGLWWAQRLCDTALHRKHKRSNRFSVANSEFSTNLKLIVHWIIKLIKCLQRKMLFLIEEILDQALNWAVLLIYQFKIRCQMCKHVHFTLLKRHSHPNSITQYTSPKCQCFINNVLPSPNVPVRLTRPNAFSIIIRLFSECVRDQLNSWKFESTLKFERRSR